MKNSSLDMFLSNLGTDVVIVKSGRRICGTGGCLANAPLHQNKSYFEFKIQSTGKLSSQQPRLVICNGLYFW